VPRSDDFVEYNDQQVRVRSSEDWDVHWNGGCVRFVEADAEIALTAQKQNDEDTDVHQADA